MQIARVIEGWRKPQIERVYDAACDVDGYYHNDELPQSHQTYARNEYYNQYRQKHHEKMIEQSRRKQNSLYGQNNKTTVLKAIARYAQGNPGHPLAKDISAETFNLVRAYLVEKGFLAEPTTTSLTGEMYVHRRAEALEKFLKNGGKLPVSGTKFNGKTPNCCIGMEQ